MSEEELDSPGHPFGEWTEDEARVIRQWGITVAESFAEKLRLSRESEREAWRDRHALVTEVERFRHEARVAGIPDGWVVVTNKGEGVDFKGRIREFFGVMLDDYGRRPDAQALAYRDEQMPALAPHRCVPIYFGRPPPEPPEGHTCHMCSNSPIDGWGLYCLECIETRMAPVVQKGTA